jgi:[methyl-Co(III) methanol-specific corrinoid protein]:coenzyme M methyltransferase
VERTYRQQGRRKISSSEDNGVLRILKGDKSGGPLCASPLVMVTTDQMKASGCYYPDAHGDPQSMARLASFIYTLVGFQGIRVPFDLCVEAEAFGCRMKKGDTESPPSVAGKAFEEKVPFQVPDDIFGKGRLGVVLDAVQILCQEFGSKVTIFPGIVGPLTLLGHLFEVSQIMRWTIKDPQRLDRNLEIAADFLSEYANRLLASGGHAMIMSDPTASGDLLSKKYFERYALPAYQRMRKKIPGPVILHICGNTKDFLDIIPLTGFEGFSFEGPTVPVKVVWHAIGKTMAVVGNIPTHDLLLYGTPDKVREASLRALEDGVDLLAPACGIPVHTALENLKAMVRAGDEFRGQRARGRHTDTNSITLVP